MSIQLIFDFIKHDYTAIFFHLQCTRIWCRGSSGLRRWAPTHLSELCSFCYWITLQLLNLIFQLQFGIHWWPSHLVLKCKHNTGDIFFFGSFGQRNAGVYSADHLQDHIVNEAVAHLSDDTNYLFNVSILCDVRNEPGDTLWLRLSFDNVLAWRKVVVSGSLHAFYHLDVENLDFRVDCPVELYAPAVGFYLPYCLS